MRGQRIILDKSVIFGLNNEEVDSLDRYFFQIVPSILVSEILADLTKGTGPKVFNIIAAHTYRVSGNHGLTLNFQKRLANSLQGIEIPMDGRFLPSGETVVRTNSGSFATIVETPLEDEILARWERREFTDQEKLWAERFRRRMERPLNPKLYFESIEKAGLSFNVPQSDEELFAVVDGLLSNKALIPRLFTILVRHFGIDPKLSDKVTKRWYRESRKPFEEFAPYAFFCLKASFVWHLSLTNPKLFKPDKNDRKDLEYCYYLPNTQIFATKDKKLHCLMRALVRPDQSLVDGDTLKQDLGKISEAWTKLTTEERIVRNAERGDAPPEVENSVVYKLWKEHDGEINPSRHKQIVDRKLVDRSLPKEEQVPFTFRDFMQRKAKEIRDGRRLSQKELDALNEFHGGKDPTTMLVFRSNVSGERLRKWHPELIETDQAELDSDDYSQIYLDPAEYRELEIID